MPIYLVMRDYEKTAIAFLIFAITSTILKFSWLDKINKIEEPNIEVKNEKQAYSVAGKT